MVGLIIMIDWAWWLIAIPISYYKDDPPPQLFPNDLSLIDLEIQAETVKQTILDLSLEGDITFIGN